MILHFSCRKGISGKANFPTRNTHTSILCKLYSTKKKDCGESVLFRQDSGKGYGWNVIKKQWFYISVNCAKSATTAVSTCRIRDPMDNILKPWARKH